MQPLCEELRVDGGRGPFLPCPYHAPLCPSQKEGYEDSNLRGPMAHETTLACVECRGSLGFDVSNAAHASAYASFVRKRTTDSWQCLPHRPLTKHENSTLH